MPVSIRPQSALASGMTLLGISDRIDATGFVMDKVLQKYIRGQREAGASAAEPEGGQMSGVWLGRWQRSRYRMHACTRRPNSSAQDMQGLASAKVKLKLKLVLAVSCGARDRCGQDDAVPRPRTKQGWLGSM